MTAAERIAPLSGNVVIPRQSPAIGLTQPEIETLNSLSDVWNKFIRLENAGFDDSREFRSAVNAAQAIIACRVAYRVNPEMWNQKV